VKACIWR